MPPERARRESGAAAGSDIQDVGTMARGDACPRCDVSLLAAMHALPTWNSVALSSIRVRSPPPDHGTKFAFVKYEACFVIRGRGNRLIETEESVMSVTASFDLVLRGGRVICPASGVDGIRDIAIRNGKIAAVAPDILPTSAKEVVDVSGKLVLPGLIDTHAHVYQYVSGRFGMNPEMVGVQSGVTTVVD